MKLNPLWNWDRGYPTVDRENDFMKYRGMTADEVELEEEEEEEETEQEEEYPFLDDLF